MKYVGGGGGSYVRWQRDFGHVLMHLISYLKWHTKVFLFYRLAMNRVFNSFMTEVPFI